MPRYFNLPNNGAANLILLWKKSILHVLIWTYFYFNLPNNHAGWNKRAGWTFLKVYCTLIRQAIAKTGKKGPNKDVQDGFFPKKNKVCCTIILQVKVPTKPQHTRILILILELRGFLRIRAASGFENWRG